MSSQSVIAVADSHTDCVPSLSEIGYQSFPRWVRSLNLVLGVSKFSVRAKRFMEHFTGFSLSARSIGDGLCDADDLIALRAPAEVVTSAIHFVPWSKPSHVHQFWIFHALQRGRSPSILCARRI